MKITILGCGSASGVPLIGNNWGACNPSDWHNLRLRSSVLVEEGDVTLLVDTSPDMRQQLLACELKHLTAVLYTHAHADHCHGIDDLRTLNWLIDGALPVYADAMAMEELKARFAYIFNFHPQGNSFTRPCLEPHVVDGPMTFGGLRVTPLLLRHGNGQSVSYRFNDFAYTTDVSDLDEEAFQAFDGIKLWVIGCIRERQHPAHGNLDAVLGWIRRVKPERAFLTHMDYSMDYATLKAKLPTDVEPAYDGLVLTC